MRNGCHRCRSPAGGFGCQGVRCAPAAAGTRHASLTLQLKLLVVQPAQPARHRTRSRNGRRASARPQASSSATRSCARRRSGLRCAAAAAIAGLTRCVRPPCPWRPSKLRFDVDAQRSPGSSRSAFIARHIEQPGFAPLEAGAMKIVSRPSRSACSFTRPEPGTTIASLTFCRDAAIQPRSPPRRRRADPRCGELVHEPMNTLSIAMSVDRACSARGPCRSARARCRRAASRRFSWSGSGTRPSIVVTISGDVPHVTCGVIVDASRSTTRSKCAPAIGLQRAPVGDGRCPTSRPIGANGRPLT